MALLQPQQQQSWFFLDLEDDGGIYEVEVDMVGAIRSWENMQILYVGVEDIVDYTLFIMFFSVGK